MASAVREDLAETVFQSHLTAPSPRALGLAWQEGPFLALSKGHLPSLPTSCLRGMFVARTVTWAPGDHSVVPVLDACSQAAGRERLPEDTWERGFRAHLRQHRAGACAGPASCVSPFRPAPGPRQSWVCGKFDPSKYSPVLSALTGFQDSGAAQRGRKGESRARAGQHLCSEAGLPVSLGAALPALPSPGLSLCLGLLGCRVSSPGRGCARHVGFQGWKEPRPGPHPPASSVALAVPQGP